MEMEKKQTIVFSDFDGTITIKDSFYVFLKYYLSPFSFWMGAILLSPILVLQKLGLMRNDKAKQIVLTYFFKGESEKIFREKACHFALTEIDKILIDKGIDCLRVLRSQGNKVVIVSASLEYYLADWCKRNGFELLATKLEVNNGLLTGEIFGYNCYGAEKVIRIRDAYNLEDYGQIIGYGDTKGDLPMLEICDKQYFKHFN
jgi:HAD superfamily hydrolase (TIGR01490 family)